MVAHDIWMASGLQLALPGTALACLSACEAIDVLRARGTEVFCLAEHAGPEVTAGMSSLDLLQHPAATAFFRGLGPTLVLSFKPSERIGEAVKQIGGELVAAPSSAARAYENKLAFIAAAERAGVPRPRWDVRRLPLDFAALAADFGETVVVQGPRGNAGQRTWLVRDQAALDAVADRERGGPVRVSEWIDGVPFTASGVAFSASGGTINPRRLPAVIEPCRQVTGIDWLTPEELGSCGNAWGDSVFDEHQAEIERCVRALGADLSANNYHGVFGVDFVLAADGPVVIEVNPRMIASLPLATELEVAAGRAPLLLLHLLELIDADLDALAGADVVGGLSPGSQVIVHHLAGDSDTRPRSGVYRVREGEAPSFVRSSAALHDLHGADELLLLTRATGQPVSDRKEFARVYARSSAGESAAGVERLVDYLRSTT